MTVVSPKCCQNKLHYRRQIIVSVHWSNLILVYRSTTPSHDYRDFNHYSQQETKLIVPYLRSLAFFESSGDKTNGCELFCYDFSRQSFVGVSPSRRFSTLVHSQIFDLWLILFNPPYRPSQPYVDLTTSPWESYRLKTRSHLFAVSRQAIPSTHLKKKRKWDLF